MKNQEMPGTLCPLCGGPNGCALAAAAPAAAGAAGGPCWCMARTIDRAVLDLLARRGRGGSCICATCAVGAAGSGQPAAQPVSAQTAP